MPSISTIICSSLEMEPIAFERESSIFVTWVSSSAKRRAVLGKRSALVDSSLQYPYLCWDSVNFWLNVRTWYAVFLNPFVTEFELFATGLFGRDVSDIDRNPRRDGGCGGFVAVRWLCCAGLAGMGQLNWLELRRWAWLLPVQKMSHLSLTGTLVGGYVPSPMTGLLLPTHQTQMVVVTKNQKGPEQRFHP